MIAVVLLVLGTGILLSEYCNAPRLVKAKNPEEAGASDAIPAFPMPKTPAEPKERETPTKAEVKKSEEAAASKTANPKVVDLPAVRHSTSGPTPNGRGSTPAKSGAPPLGYVSPTPEQVKAALDRAAEGFNFRWKTAPDAQGNSKIINVMPLDAAILGNPQAKMVRLRRSLPFVVARRVVKLPSPVGSWIKYNEAEADRMRTKMANEVTRYRNPFGRR